MSFRKYPAFTRVPKVSRQLYTQGVSSAGGPSAGGTVAPYWRRRMQMTGSPAHQLFAMYGAAAGGSGGSAKPWLYRANTQTLGVGFVRTP